MFDVSDHADNLDVGFRLRPAADAVITSYCLLRRAEPAFGKRLIDHRDFGGVGTIVLLGKTTASQKWHVHGRKVRWRYLRTLNIGVVLGRRRQTCHGDIRPNIVARQLRVVGSSYRADSRDR